MHLKALKTYSFPSCFSAGRQYTDLCTRHKRKITRNYEYIPQTYVFIICRLVFRWGQSSIYNKNLFFCYLTLNRYVLWKNLLLFSSSYIMPKGVFLIFIIQRQISKISFSMFVSFHDSPTNPYLPISFSGQVFHKLLQICKFFTS